MRPIQDYLIIMETRGYYIESFLYISKSADDTSIYEADDEKTTSLHTTDDESLVCDDTTSEVTSDDVRCSTPKRGSKRRLSVTLSPVRNEQPKRPRVSCSLFSSDELSSSTSPTPSEFNFQLILHPCFMSTVFQEHMFALFQTKGEATSYH